MFIMHAAPSGILGSVSFSDVNLTSITVQWTELPCSDRNGEITGYTVEYSSTTPPQTNTVTVSGSSTTRLAVGGLLPRTNYTFSVRAQGAAARNATRFTATPSSMCHIFVLYGEGSVMTCPSISPSVVHLFERARGGGGGGGGLRNCFSECFTVQRVHFVINFKHFLKFRHIKLL